MGHLWHLVWKCLKLYLVWLSLYKLNLCLTELHLYDKCSFFSKYTNIYLWPYLETETKTHRIKKSQLNSQYGNTRIISPNWFQEPIVTGLESSESDNPQNYFLFTKQNGFGKMCHFTNSKLKLSWYWTTC